MLPGPAVLRKLDHTGQNMERPAVAESAPKASQKKDALRGDSRGLVISELQWVSPGTKKSTQNRYSRHKIGNQPTRGLFIARGMGARLTHSFVLGTKVFRGENENFAPE